MTSDPFATVGQGYGITGGGVPVTVHTSRAISAGANGFGRTYPMWVEFRPGRVCRLHPDAVNQFFLPPGRYLARFYSTYVFIDVGKAELTFDISSGEPVQMAYAAPYSIYSKGTAGFTPQKRPGRGVIVGIYAVVIGAVVAMFAVTLVRHLLNG